ncbi:MAG: hypothetical protein ABF326_11630 [Arenicellales bacterium]
MQSCTGTFTRSTFVYGVIRVIGTLEKTASIVHYLDIAGGHGAAFR